ncbi:hypothetical protein M9H77_37007 [Catharanthus roseus]|uniref:Uncharacterized protein n=1 Tax=Catharanthus roseus TaxID=4058 RepID=A0ACB9ZXN8_CATRO|nr:hypothetical protein M9H77_37007 [Catharanthus roseus]
MTNYSNSGKSAKPIEAGIVPKVEVSDYDLPSADIYSKNLEGNAASSSSSRLRSSFIGMGFSPSLVDRAIEENGEDNEDLLLETLFAYSAQQESKSSDSLDSIFGDDDETCSRPNQIKLAVKAEPDAYDGVSNKEATLLRMSFSVDEVEFALAKLGEDAHISELVDFIFAARMAVNHEKNANAKGDQDSSTEAMFGTMEKTLVLLEMGFSEKEVSTAIEKCGSKVPVSELTASILAEQGGGTYVGSAKYYSTVGDYHFIDPSIKHEYGSDAPGNFDFLEKLKGKRPREQPMDDRNTLKRPKPEYEADTTLLELRLRNSASFPRGLKPVPGRRGQPKPKQIKPSEPFNMPMPNSCRAHDKMVASAPYFLYGNATSLSRSSWNKISQYLYAIQPELVNTRSFSALSRQEGYLHNVPTEGRFRVHPKPPMSIVAAIPNANKWWPLWDTREHLSYVNTEVVGVSELCERLRRTLYNSKGVMAAKQQEEILEECRMYNLVWVGKHELAPIPLAHLESIIGCPIHHTGDAGLSLTERLQCLEECLQIDTLAYHLSGLKPRFPQGITVLSIHSGLGAVEIALHRLGIQLKLVVSVEPAETKRKILKRWWENSGISGELVQMENIHSNKLNGMIDKYGGFDFVVCEDGFCRPVTTTTTTNINTPSDFDFQNLCEFARILARVRRVLEKKKK